MHIFGIDELTGLISVPPTILRPAPSTPHLQPVGAGVGVIGVVVDGVGVGATVVVGPVIIGVVVFIEISPP